MSICLSVCTIGCSFFQGLSLDLRSHDQFQASHWSLVIGFTLSYLAASWWLPHTLGQYDSEISGHMKIAQGVQYHLQRSLKAFLETNTRKTIKEICKLSKKKYKSTPLTNLESPKETLHTRKEPWHLQVVGCMALEGASCMALQGAVTSTWPGHSSSLLEYPLRVF